MRLPRSIRTFVARWKRLSDGVRGFALIMLAVVFLIALRMITSSNYRLDAAADGWQIHLAPATLEASVP